MEADTLRFRPDRRRTGLGVAVDIGTTTVVLYLYGCNSGSRLATASGTNAQRWAGADAISRIQYTVEHPGGLDPCLWRPWASCTYCWPRYAKLPGGHWRRSPPCPLRAIRSWSTSWLASLRAALPSPPSHPNRYLDRWLLPTTKSWAPPPAQRRQCRCACGSAVRRGGTALAVTTEKCRYLELSGLPQFNEAYLNCMACE